MAPEGEVETITFCCYNVYKWLQLLLTVQVPLISDAVRKRHELSGFRVTYIRTCQIH